MRPVDFVARGRAQQNRSFQRRLDTIDRALASIARSYPLGLPGVMGTPITENRSATTQIASGTTYGFNYNTPGSDYRHHFSLYGGDWDLRGKPGSYPDYVTMQGTCNTLGNGNDPTTNPNKDHGVVARFQTWADQFEILAVNYLGFRVKVNGKYAKDGLYGVQALNGDTASNRFFLFDFAGTEFAGEGLKQVEIVGHNDFRFQGVRVPMAYTVAPWPASAGVKACLHGDSKVSTVSDSADYRTARHFGFVETVQALSGVVDTRPASQGGCGFVADSSGTKSDFLEAAAIDFPGRRFDLVWETGGYNDGTPGTEAAYTALVRQWIATVLADNPDAVIVLTGPIPSSNSHNYATSSAFALIQRAKKAAAAAYPQNCAFIETIGNATIGTDAWIFGTGKVGSTTGNGNADKLTGTDGVHPSIAGHLYLGARLVAETARALPLLADRIRRGVIVGVNDLDLV